MIKYVKVSFKCPTSNYSIGKEYILKKVIAEKFEMVGYLNYMIPTLQKPILKNRKVYKD